MAGNLVLLGKLKNVFIRGIPMSENIDKNIPRVETPSRARIAAATMVAALVAAVVLLVAVLPAEYGVDPLGTGKALGLTDLAKAAEKKAAPEPAPAKTIEDAATIAPVLEASPDGGAPRLKGAFIA